MNATGKYIWVDYQGTHYALCNQRSREWSHPYAYEGNGSTLSSAGCGVFAVAHAACYLGGKRVKPEELADFSCENGGRGDDGTDRPALLSAMEEKGLARDCGFFYRFDGLRNDLDALFSHMTGGGAALCNLRPGHIVALTGARTVDGERQVLAVDSYSESGDERVKEAVRECVPGSEIISSVLNGRGNVCGFLCGYGLYWASLSAVRDFNLLHRIFPKP